MEISVKTVSSPSHTINLDVKPNDSIKKVKTKIQVCILHCIALGCLLVDSVNSEPCNNPNISDNVFVNIVCRTGRGTQRTSRPSWWPGPSCRRAGLSLTTTLRRTGPSNWSSQLTVMVTHL